MSTSGWVFMVGLRVVDLAALLGWLVWFFRLRDDPDDGRGDDERGGGGEGPPPEPDGPAGPSDGLLLPDADDWPVRLRDHTSRPARRRRVRRAPRPRRRERIR